MKKLTTVSIFMFWAVVTALLSAGLVFYDKSKAPASNIANVGTSTNTDNINSGNNSIALNIAEIAKHKSLNDCWLLISNKVYNVTSFISSHPGGSQAVTSFCGKEATKAFDTRGGNGTHSSSARNLLAEYYIGDLNNSASASIIEKTHTVTPTVQGEQEDEDDD